MDDKQKEEFNNNMMLQKIAGIKKQMATKIIERHTNEDLFPVKKLSEKFKVAAHKSIMLSSPLSYQARIQDFAKAVKAVFNLQRDPKYKITLKEFSIMANSLDAVSPSQLGLSEMEYVELIEETCSLVDIWEKLITDINNSSFQEAEAEYNQRALVDPSLPRLKVLEKPTAQA